MGFARAKSIVSAGAIALAALLGAGSGANAITWNFSNVPLSDGNVLSGFFSTDTNPYGYLASWSLTTSGPNNTFANFAYNPSTGYYNDNGANVLSSTSITFNNPDYSEVLQITFANVISDATNAILGGIGGPSFEQCSAWGICRTNFIRYIASETAVGDPLVSATPLPSTWTLLIAGFVGLGFIACRGTKKNSATFAAA
jgi:hypothetical protein